MKHPALLGYDAYELGECIHKQRIAKGISVESLSEKTGVPEDQLHALMLGKGVPAAQEAQVQSVVRALGPEPLSAFMAETRTLPRVNKPELADIFHYLIKKDRLSVKEVAKRAGIAKDRLKNFIEHEDYGLTLPECFAIATKAFGERDIGTLVKRADALAALPGADLDDAFRKIVPVHRHAHAEHKGFQEREQHRQAAAQIDIKPHMGAYERGKVSAAIERLRLSKGIRNKTLAELTGTRVNDLRRYEAGLPCLPTEKLQDIAKVLGVGHADNLVPEAERLPDITKTAVAEAMVKALAPKGFTSLASFEKKLGMKNGALAHFAQNREVHQPKSMALETTMPAVNALGYESLGALLLAQGFPPVPVESRNRTRTISAATERSNQSWTKLVTELDAVSSHGTRR